MGFYIRQSVKVGPLRFNISKSGIGVSAGIRGFRVGTGPRGNYVHMGVGGLYYRQSLPPVSRPAIGNRLLEDHHAGKSPITHGPMVEITSEDVSRMVDSSSAGLLRELEEKKNRVQAWPIALSLSGLFIAILLSLHASKLIVIPFSVVCAAVVAYSGYFDVLTKSVVIMYDLDEETKIAFKHLYDAFLGLSECHRIWHVDSRGQVYDRKYHAGASNLVDRRFVTVGPGDPPYVKSNISPIKIPIGKRSMYFFPDRVLVFGSDGIGAIAYSDLEFGIDSTRFIEREGVPRDARVVDQTWQYVNKNGSPDRRFSSNRQLPICLYEEIGLRTQSGLNEIFQVSRLGIGSGLEAAVQNMARRIQIASAAEVKRLKNAEIKRLENKEPQQSLAFQATAAAGDDSSQSNGDQTSRLPGFDELCSSFLQILCCVMVADGRASRAERECIQELMQKAKSPWTVDEVNRRVNSFIDTVRFKGFKKVLDESLLGVPLFKKIGKADVLCRCIDLVANRNGVVDERERAICNRIKEMLETAV